MGRQGMRVTNVLDELRRRCFNRNNLAMGNELCSDADGDVFELNSFLGNPHICSFSSCRSLANDVSSKQVEPNVSLRCANISTQVKLGQYKQVIELYHQMKQSSVQLGDYFFIDVLKACSGLAALSQGKLIHSHIIESLPELSLFVGNTLIDMYSKCGSLDDARRVFVNMPMRTVVTWTAMISGHAHHGHYQDALQLFQQMHQEGLEPNDVTFTCVLKACSCMETADQGKVIHAHIIENGVELDVFMGSTLIDMYAKCGSLADARNVFDKLSKQNVVTWSAMVEGYAQHDHGNEALQLYEEMVQQQGVKPNTHTFVSSLKACSSIAALDQGKLIHIHIIRSGYETAEFVVNTLVDMYAKCGSLEDAFRVFTKVTKPNVVRWNAMIAGCAQYGNGKEALSLFQKMLKEGLEPDNATLISILKACSCIANLEQGKVIHAFIIKNCCELDDMVGSTLIYMYANCASLDNARNVFDRSPKEDVVTWNTMIAGYAQQSCAHEAVQLYQKMQLDGIEPDNVTFISIPKACCGIAALKLGKLIHADIIGNGCELDLSIGNTLINMYAKCGNLEDASRVFNMQLTRDLLSWSAMIAGYSQHNNYELALRYFQDMQQAGLKPNDVTFLSLLSACSHKGLVDEGFQHFKSMMDDYGISPTVDHCNCMIDLLGRAGRLKQAEEILETLPFQSNITGWTSLLTHCRIHGNVELGRRSFDHVVAIDSKYASGYVMMSNIYADAGMWKEAEVLENERRKAQAWKKLGKSCIEVNNTVHDFSVGDKRHPRIAEIYKKLRSLGAQMKKGGFLPHVHSVLQKMSDEEKEDYLCGHCEKLAIAFGLISTPPGTPITVSKNLRVCIDCHSATKVISKIEGREITVIDAYRVHCFKDGFCSCNDFY